MGKYLKILLISPLVIVLIGVAVVVGRHLFFGENAPDTTVNAHYVDMYKFEQKSALEQVFAENGLKYKYANNTVEQYESIKQHLKEEDMIVYYEALGITETKKICQVFGYEDLDDFLLKNSHVDEEGEPSISAMRAAAEIYMTEYMSKKINKAAFGLPESGFVYWQMSLMPFSNLWAEIMPTCWLTRYPSSSIK